MKRTIYYWIDHTARTPFPTGMQRVVRNTARALLEQGEDLWFVSWSDETEAIVLAPHELVRELSAFSGPSAELMGLSRYVELGSKPLHLSAGFAARPGVVFVPEVTHITFHDAPRTLAVIEYAKRHGLRTAFVFYDAIPLKVDQYRAAAPAHARYMQHISLADLVLPISHASAQDLRRFFVEELCCDASTTPRIVPLPVAGEISSQPRATQYRASAAEHLILSVGTIEPRKNQVRLVHAFEQVVRRHPDLPLKLALCGNIHPAMADELRAAEKRCASIEVKNYVEEAELIALYRSCAFTVFPSLEEGFGLPILESLWFGKPAICANFGAMSEVARAGGCLTVDVRSESMLAEAIERLCRSPAALRDLADEALAVPIRTWREYAADLGRALEPALAAQLGVVLYFVDHTAAYPGNSGIQRVVRMLARALLDAGVQLAPVRWYDQKGTFVPASAEQLAHLEKWSGPKADAWTTYTPELLRTASWLIMPELTYAPELRLVLRRARENDLRSAMVFFDALPYKLRDFYGKQAADAHARYMRDAIEADLVIAISETSRDELHRFVAREAERPVGVDRKLAVITLPCALAAAPPSAGQGSARDGAVRILSVGTIEPRKNHLALLEAFVDAAARAEKPIQLTLVGGAPHPELKQKLLKAIARAPNARWLGPVDDAGLERLYRESDFSVYPSVEEGFGLPVLESLSQGKPCICSSTGATAEIARDGGCVSVDTRNASAIADAIVAMVANGGSLQRELAQQAARRTFKSVEDYGAQFIELLASSGPHPARTLPARRPSKLAAPLLSICVTTYNRAAWLRVCLAQLVRLTQPYRDVIEIVVCDNASTDDTPAVVAEFADVPNLRSARNRANVGMLGNLQVTAHEALGRHVWLLGDDDIVHPGAIERILSVLIEQPDVALVYLNYSYTRRDAPTSALDIDAFLADATPVSPPGPDRDARIAALAPLSESFFTAIYCLVLRRDHALFAYSQNTSERPFSTLCSCVPTAYYVVTRLLNTQGHWIGTPCVTVNQNVSWMRYAPLWVLERMPELHELGETMGVDAAWIDRQRARNLEGVQHWLRQIYNDDPEGNAAYFDFARFVRRHKHVPEFGAQLGELMGVYARAHAQSHPRATQAPAELLAGAGLAAHAPADPRRAALAHDAEITYLRASRPPPRNTLQAFYWGFAGVTLTPFYWLAAWFLRAPGMRERWLSFRLGMRILLSQLGALSLRGVYSLLFNPMDSTRYFELEFALGVLRNGRRLNRYLDVSSPRLLFTLLLLEHPDAEAHLVNPDRSDLADSAILLGASGVLGRSRLHPVLIESAPFPPGSFDLVTSISVVEHIPRDREAIAKMWELLAPGGRLLLTLPCAARASEQYIDRDEYGLHAGATPGWLFWQRFYDQALLEERVFSVTGRPARTQLYGEREPGLLQGNAQRKRSARFYPFWREPYMMAREYRRFGGIL